MKIVIEIEVGDREMTDTDRSEAVRLMFNVGEAILDGTFPGTLDALALTDFNDDPAGKARLEPSGWAVGDEVWDSVSGRRCVVAEVRPDRDGMQYVWLRDSLTSETRASWYVYADGRDDSGRCWISRRVQS